MGWTVATYTTVGYGDLSHSGDAGTKWFLIGYVLVGVSMSAAYLAGFAHLYLKNSMKTKLKKIVEQGVTVNMIKAMDADGDGDVDLAEFLAFMLVKMRKVDAKAIDDLKGMFAAVDLTETGRLTLEDVR